MTTNNAITIRHLARSGEVHSTDLAGTLAALSSGEVESFPALRPHQVDAWHMLTVQIAVLAIEAAGLDAPPVDSADWNRMLGALTPEWPDGEPWMLTVEDPSMPAFLQPPCTNLRGVVTNTPDELDTLVAGRNHDLKKAVISDASPDDWLFALVTLQTTEGSMGAGTKAVSRINGGYGSRSIARIVPPGGASSAFQRDVSILLRQRREHPVEDARSNLSPLLWTRPIDDEPSSALQAIDLDPLYVEVCRRVRLNDGEDGMVARLGSSPKTQPVVSDRGQTRCPWTPIMLDREPRAYSPGDDSDWRTLSRLLDPETTRLPLLARPHPEDTPGARLRIAGLRRGQGATERFDVHDLPVSVGSEDPFDKARVRASALDRGWKALRMALLVAFQKAPERVRFDDKLSSDWANAAAVPFQQEFDVDPRNAANPIAAAADAARRTYADRTSLLPGRSMPATIMATAVGEGRLESMLRREEGN